MKLSALPAPPLGHLVIIVAALLSYWFAVRGPAVPSTLDPANTAGDVQPVVSAGDEFALERGDLQIPDDLFLRPLMAEGRRVRTLAEEKPEVALPAPPPAPAPVTEPAAVDQSRPEIVFKGFMIASGEPKALLAWGSGGAEEWYPIGAERDGWRIVEINDLSVTVSRGSDDITINMFD